MRIVTSSKHDPAKRAPGPFSPDAQQVLQTARPLRRQLGLLCLVALLLVRTTLAQTPDPEAPAELTDARQAPITPIPQPPTADPLKLALGERLFADHRLSHNDILACSSCHDLHSNGAENGRQTLARDGSKRPFDTPTVFNAALNFRLNWEGNIRSLEAQAQSSLENPANMASSVDEVVAKLNADPQMVHQFGDAYENLPNRTNFLDAIAIYERSLLTPGSRFDMWLTGDPAALTADEQAGYTLFKSLGCISCHQGVNVGGNLYQRHGIFHPLASPKPEILRVPSLRNVATTAPYFHDGSALTLDDAVRKMAAAQLDRTLSNHQTASIVAFLKTLTGRFHGEPVVAAPP